MDDIRTTNNTDKIQDLIETRPYVEQLVKLTFETGQNRKLAY